MIIGKEFELDFKKIVGGNNFMTPEVVGYYKKGDYIAELSTGNGKFCGLYCYGVTVANTKTRKHEVDMCKSFSDPHKDVALKQAMDYINSLA